MTKKVFSLDTLPGVQRDGTLFNKEYYSDGRWVRFQRKRPRKIGGYREITPDLAGPSRGIYLAPRGDFNNVYSGYSDGVQVLPINNNGIGAGITDMRIGGEIATVSILDAGTGYTNGTYTNQPLIYPGTGDGLSAYATIVVAGGVITSVTLTSGGMRFVAGDQLTANIPAGSGLLIQVDTINSPFTPSDEYLWQFDTFVDSANSQNNLLLAHPSQDLNNIDSQVNTPLLIGPINGTILYAAGVFSQEAATITSGSPTVTLSVANLNIGAGQAVRGPGIAAGTKVLSISTTTLTLTQNATANGSNVDLIFDNEINVSGGVVTLHPYVFVYGNDGLIRNCAAGNIDDWTSAEANAVNVATGKIVQGLPVRGGSNAPSGLFWSLDSLIRVSYNPTNVVVGGTTITQYWRYDIITSQSSLLSAQSIIEYDGIYFWCGVDRFLLYNGVVKEIPNDLNQNYFFDNINYNLRQKVWVTKVPRFGEVWWLYPRGDDTEATDAVMYNIRENAWYDAGSALGSRRSAGYFSQVFRFPLEAGWEANATGTITRVSITNAGTGYTDGTYPYISLTGGAGTGASATFEVYGGIVTKVTIEDKGSGYVVGNTLTASFGSGADVEITVDAVNDAVSLWQHEVGKDEVKGTMVNAIESYFTTSDLGVIAGGPSQFSPVGENKWTRLERVEPDFLLDGTMDLYIVGRPYPQQPDKITGPYTFDDNTSKIDMKEQRRILRLKFVSDVVGGDYQLGKVILDADFGDTRGYTT